MSEEGRKGRKEGPSERILTPLTTQDGESARVCQVSAPSGETH